MVVNLIRAHKYGNSDHNYLSLLIQELVMKMLKITISSDSKDVELLFTAVTYVNACREFGKLYQILTFTYF